MDAEVEARCVFLGTAISVDPSGSAPDARCTPYLVFEPSIPRCAPLCCTPLRCAPPLNTPLDRSRNVASALFWCLDITRIASSAQLGISKTISSRLAHTGKPVPFASISPHVVTSHSLIHVVVTSIIPIHASSPAIPPSWKPGHCLNDPRLRYFPPLSLCVGRLHLTTTVV